METIRVALPKKYDLVVGDMFQCGQWPEEAYRRLTSVNGEPKGLGFMVNLCDSSSIDVDD